MKENYNKGMSNTIFAVIAVVIIAVIAVGAYIAYANPFATPVNNTLPSASITAGGASFPYPLISQWTSSYNILNPQVQITYQSVGSGTGQKGLFNMTFDFAASDAPLTDAQMAANPGIVHIPETCGGVTLAYNVPGLPSGLNLTANVIAEIFQGSITKWNDPQIVALNPGFSSMLPNTAITPVHRLDSSGTTNIFSTYLVNASTMWTLGSGTTINFPGGLSGSGNSGVASVINVTTGSIGYIEYYYAASNGIPFANVQDHDGQFVTPSLSTIGAAANLGATLLQSNIRSPIVNLAGSNVYPISSFTYLLVRTNMTYLGQAKAIDITSFIWWAVHSGGQAYSQGLFYPKLPSSVVTLDENIINQLTYNNAAVAFIKQ